MLEGVMLAGQLHRNYGQAVANDHAHPMYWYYEKC